MLNKLLSCFDLVFRTLKSILFSEKMLIRPQESRNNDGKQGFLAYTNFLQNYL